MQTKTAVEVFSILSTFIARRFANQTLEGETMIKNGLEFAD